MPAVLSSPTLTWTPTSHKISLIGYKKMFWKTVCDEVNSRQYLIGSFTSMFAKETIYCRSSIPIPIPTPTVRPSALAPIHLFIIHGLTEYHKDYRFLIEKLERTFKENIIISTLDLKGFGLSCGRKGHINHFEEYLFDFIFYYNYLNKFMSKKKNIQVKHNIFLGNSLGANIGLQLALEYPHLLATRPTSMIFKDPIILPRKNSAIYYLCCLFNNYCPRSSPATNPLTNLLLDKLLQTIRIPLFNHHDHLLSNSLTLQLICKLLTNVQRVDHLLPYLHLATCKQLYLLSNDHLLFDYQQILPFINHSKISRENIEYFFTDKNDPEQKHNHSFTEKSLGHIVNWLNKFIYPRPTTFNKNEKRKTKNR